MEAWDVGFKGEWTSSLQKKKLRSGEVKKYLPHRRTSWRVSRRRNPALDTQSSALHKTMESFQPVPSASGCIRPLLKRNVSPYIVA